MPGPEGLVKALKPELDKVFKPAFLGRLVIVPYFPVRDEILRQIIVLKLDRIRRRILENHKVHLLWDEAVLDEIAKRCTEIESGARNIDSILTNTLLPEISRQMLGRLAAGEPAADVRVSVMAEGGFVYS
jgi:type VI secretion system protein VasG